ncbi:MAG: ComEC/Rec2 family competence protein, partial [Anaerovorax sp.]
MRRPIVAVLLGFAGGIAIGYAVQIEFEVLVIGAFAVVLTTFFLVVHFKKQKAVWRRGLSLFAVFLFLGGISVTLVEGWPHPLLEEENKRVTVEGVVLSVQEKEEDYFKITLRTEGEKVLVHVAGRPELQGVSWCAKDLMGRKLQVSGLVEKPSERRNPGTFDYRLYLKTRGIYAIIKVKEYDVALPSPQVNFVTHSLAQLKYGFIEKLTQSIDEDTTGMLVGMLFGDKTLIDEDTYEAFQRNGIAHILSVSGIHVGIVYVCINKIFGNRRSWLLTILSISFLLFYAALAEFSPSVVRAVTMIVVHMMSKMAFQRYDLTSCTCACAFGMLVINPFYLFNIGFQLSYLAVLTLGVALPWTNRRIEFLKEGTCPNFLIVALSFIAPLLVIQVGMAPYTAYCFNYFSLAAIVLNIPIIFLAGWVIPVGIVLMGIFVLEGVFLKIPVLAHFLDALFDFTGFIEVLLIDSMDYANTLFYQTGKSFFFVTSPSPFAIMVYYGLLFFLLSEWFRILYQRKQWKRMGKIIGVGLLLSFLLSTLLIKDYSKSNLIFVDVGQGDCLHLRTPGGKNVLID